MEKSPGLLQLPLARSSPQFVQERHQRTVKLYKTSWTWLYALIIFVFLINVLRYCLNDGRSLSQDGFAAGPANATLGFGAIYAVSRSNSPRRAQLERAADLTGLDIRVPIQPKWQNGDIERVQALENSTLDRGSALAWLGHLNALHRFLNSSYETALIVEDDIDFDTHIRTEQIPATANAIRALLHAQHQSKYYYGDPALWDILWLGHCGDHFDTPRASKLSTIKMFTDKSLPLREFLLPATRKFMESLGIQFDHQRIVHRSVNPLCSFAYAVNRMTAKRLVTDYAVREPSRASHRPCSAYDVRLLEACRDDGFKCVTVTPELFHHTLAPSEIAAVSTDSPVETKSDLDSPDTPNIGCSARSSLWWTHKYRYSSSHHNSARGRTLSKLAQRSGSCYLDKLRQTD